MSAIDITTSLKQLYLLSGNMKIQQKTKGHFTTHKTIIELFTSLKTLPLPISVIRCRITIVLPLIGIKMYKAIVMPLLLTCSLMALEKQVSIATCEWEPFFGSDLPMHGFFYEIVHEILTTEGYTVSIQFMPWSEAVENVKENKQNLLLGAYHTKEREKDFLYPLPVYDIKLLFISRKELNIRYDGNLQNLKGYIIGVSKGYVYNTAFDQATFLTKKEYSGPDELLEKIINEEVDIIVIAGDVATYLLKKKYKPHINSLTALGPSLGRKQLFTPVSKKNPHHKQLVEDFNRGLIKLIKRNGIEEIYGKHITGNRDD